MENIYAIVISDFGEKIHFIHKKLNYDYENCVKIIKSLNKSLATNYLMEYVANGLDIRLMDTMINSKLKIKISIVGEILVEILYDSNIDFNYLNAVNLRLLEALYFIAKTKKMKIEHLIKKFAEVNQILEDSLYLFDPRIRLTSKNGNIGLKESQQHMTYSTKFKMASASMKNMVYHLSTKYSNSVKENLENKKNLRNKNFRTIIPISPELAKLISNNKKTHLNFYSNQTSEKKKIEIKKNFNIFHSSNTEDLLDSNKQNEKTHGNMLLNIDFNLLNKENTGSLSFNSKQNTNLLNGTYIQNIEYKFKSSNMIDKTLDLANNFENSYMTYNTQIAMVDNLNPNEGKFLENLDNRIYFDNQNDQKFPIGQYSTLEKSLNSLAQVDLNGLLESINFSSNDNSRIKNNFHIAQTDLSNNSFDYSKNSKNNFSNALNFSENTIRLGFEKSSVNPNKQKDIDMFSNFDNLLQIDTAINEDRIEKTLIKKQEKGILLNNKGKYEDVKYRGQVALELTNNFHIKNKSFFLKIFHPNWNDSNSFKKLIPDKIIVEDKFNGNYKISCNNVKNFLRLIDYNINIRIIEPGAEFKVTGTYKENKYKLEIKSLLNSKVGEVMKGSQMNIVIIVKSNEINILKATNTSYAIDDKIITYTINDFNKEPKMLIGIVFKTTDREFVEVVKITYRYMDILPTSNNGELLVYDEFNQPVCLDVVKKCLVEVRFIP